MLEHVAPSLAGYVDYGLGGTAPVGPGPPGDTVSGGPWVRVGARDLIITWESTSGPGTVFQVYIDRRLAWTGTGTRAVLPRPGRSVTVEVIPVDPGHEKTDYSGTLPAIPGRSVVLEWSGGRYLGAGLVAFRIYRGPSPGGPVSYSGKPLARVAWAPPGNDPDGFGVGGFGSGGFGHAAIRYTWTSPPMAGGLWTFGVVPEDASGALGTPVEATIDHAPAPEPPGQGPDGSRLRVAVDPATRIPTLTWIASPG